jgi:Fic family protein
MEKFVAGKYINQGYYKSFQPNPIHRDWGISSMEVISLLSKADRQLGRLDMYSEYVNIDLCIRMHIAKEATQLSKIEGTQTNMEDAFSSREEVSLDKRDDWEEVQNYIQAMNKAVKLLHTLPFSYRLIKQTHKILLQGVRGAKKLSGEFRISQNWIGGASINDAMFIPLIHTSFREIMSDLEQFANNELNHLPDLLKITIIHYQFETIHRFLDGNGRVGRLLITLYLVNKGILKQPMLYLSDFFERNRLLYYDNLMRLRSNYDLNQWLKFFLTGVIETAKKGVTTFDGIMQLQKTLELKIKGLGNRSVDAKKVIDYLYTQPVIGVSRVGGIIQKSNVTAYKLLNTLEEIKVLKEVSGAQRNKLYVFNEYINLFKTD